MVASPSTCADLAASAQVDGEATITVAAGLYVVRAGEKAVKVVVK